MQQKKSLIRKLQKYAQITSKSIVKEPKLLRNSSVKAVLVLELWLVLRWEHLVVQLAWRLEQ